MKTSLARHGSIRGCHHLGGFPDVGLIHDNFRDSEFRVLRREHKIESDPDACIHKARDLLFFITGELNGAEFNKELKVSDG